MHRLAQLIVPIFFLCLLSSSAKAQKVGEWKMYPSYSNPTVCLAVDDCVFALCGSGNLLKYDVTDDAEYTFDYYTSLSDIHIQYMAYCKNQKTLVLVYDNGNVDLMDVNENIHNLSALKNSSLLNKTVNKVRVIDNIAYICTGFGFIEVNIPNCNFGETYKLNVNVTDLVEKDDYVYINTSEGVKRAKKDANFHSPDVWESSSSMPSIEEEMCKAGGYYWKAEGFNGLRGYKNLTDATPSKIGAAMNGLSYDLFYKIRFRGDKLYIVGGDHSTNYFVNFNAGYLQDEEWHNISEKTFQESCPEHLRKNIVSIAVDPQDENHMFMSSVNNGLIEYKDNKFIKLYNRHNAPIVSAIPTTNTVVDEYTCVSNLHYDDNNNLWMTNVFADTVVKVMQPNGNWKKIHYPDISGVRVVHDVVQTSLGYNFLLCSESAGALFGFTLGSTLGSKGKQKYVEGITNQDGTSYTPLYYYCLTEDQNGILWLGTSAGLFLIDDQDDFFTAEKFQYEQIKVNRNDGSGLADYRLSGVEITSIVVDPSNKKWIGTKGNGLYLLSGDGQEMLEHFLVENSKILSNNVNSLAYDGKTGLLYIATDAGLCSYQTASINPEETLEHDNILIYPNPVEPGYNGLVTIKGLTQNAEVKIVTTGGQVVWGATSDGGICTWNCCDMRGSHVASGIYHVIANTSDGEKAVVGRVVVMK